MNDREKLRKIYELIDKYRFYRYEDLTKWKLYNLKEDIYDILIGRNRKDGEAIFINNKSRYKETIF